MFFFFLFSFLFFLFITIYRWFILSDNCLFYFKTPSDVEPCGIIPLESILLLSPSLLPLVPPPPSYYLPALFSSSCPLNGCKDVTVTIAPASVNKRAHCFMLQNHTQELMKACKVGSDGTLVKANHLVYFVSHNNMSLLLFTSSLLFYPLLF